MAGYPGSLRRPMHDWRDAVWRAVPEGAEPERFAARRAFLLAHVAAGRARARPRLRRRRLRRRAPATPAASVTMADVAGEALRRARARAPGAEAVRARGGRAAAVRRGRLRRRVGGRGARARGRRRRPAGRGAPRAALGRDAARDDAVARPRRRRRPTRTSTPAPTTCASSARGPCGRVLADAGFASVDVRRAGRGLHASAPATWHARRARATYSGGRWPAGRW